MANIFDKQRLGPKQMRSVAERRFADAQYLRKSNHNRHANGAMYLGGFVLECLLKARMLETYDWLQRPGDVSKRSKPQQQMYGLCYRSHDLAGIVEHLPAVRSRLQKIDSSGRLFQMLMRLCGMWTVFARYSTQQAQMTEACDFLDNIKELKEWLR